MNLLDAAVQLNEHVGMFGVCAAQWVDRENSTDQAAARRAASKAVDALDAALGEVYRARAELVAQVRAHDDAELAAMTLDPETH